MAGRGVEVPKDEGSYTANLDGLDVLDATFARADQSVFTDVDRLGLHAVGQHIEPDRAVIARLVAVDDSWLRHCGFGGMSRDSVVRQLAHAPVGWRPTTLHVVVRHNRCNSCGHVWRRDTGSAGGADGEAD